MGWLRSLGFMGNVNTNIYSEMLLVTLKENMKKRQKVWTDCCCHNKISYIKTQNQAQSNTQNPLRFKYGHNITQYTIHIYMHLCSIAPNPHTPKNNLNICIECKPARHSWRGCNRIGQIFSCIFHIWHRSQTYTNASASKVQIICL